MKIANVGFKTVFFFFFKSKSGPSWCVCVRGVKVGEVEAQL